MRRVVFVMSPGHSGSTLLDLILGSHSEGFSIGEMGSLPNFMEDGHLPESVCGICDGPCPLWDRPGLARFVDRYLRWAGGSALERRLDGHLGGLRGNLYRRLFRETGAELLIDSSKRVRWIRRQLLPCWHWRDTEPFLLFLHRDGRAVVNSVLRKYPQRGVRPAARDWAATIVEMELCYEGFPAERRGRLSYEELAERPAETIRALCDRLGIAFEPGMLDFWRHDHHIVLGNSGTRSLIHRFRAGGSSGGGDDSPDFYRQVTIRPDRRWRDELSAQDLRWFGSVAGELNRRYADPGVPVTTP